MKTINHTMPSECNVVFERETRMYLRNVPPGTVAEQSAKLGIAQAEPLLVAMNALLRYAKAYAVAQDGSRLKDDGVLGPAWLDAAKGIRALLNGDGAVAMERNITTDSKDNGAIEDIFWAAMAAAGFEESDL